MSDTLTNYGSTFGGMTTSGLLSQMQSSNTTATSYYTTLIQQTMEDMIRDISSSRSYNDVLRESEYRLWYGSTNINDYLTETPVYSQNQEYTWSIPTTLRGHLRTGIDESRLPDPIKTMLIETVVTEDELNTIKKRYPNYFKSNRR